MESKKEKFDRIMPTRLENFEIAGDRLSKLSNKQYFEYTEEEAKSIINRAEKIVKMLKLKFNK